MGRTKIAMRAEARDALATLGALVRQRRLARSSTLEELAARAGVSPRTVSQVEKGDPAVSVGNVFNVATVVGVPLFGTSDTEMLTLLSARARAEVPERKRARSRSREVIADGDVDF